jgi:hypothetical protein
LSDFSNFWFKLVYMNDESRNLEKIKRINLYIDFCDEIFVFLSVLFVHTVNNNWLYTKICKDEKIELTYALRENGFFLVNYKDKSERTYSLNFSFYDYCYWVILKEYAKDPVDIFDCKLNFNFVFDEIQQYYRKMFYYIITVNKYFNQNKDFNIDLGQKKDFSQLTNLNLLDPKLNFFKNWDELYIANSYDLLVWFFLVDLSKLGPVKNTDEFFYLKYVVLLQYNFAIFFQNKISDNVIRFNSYKIILFCLIKLSKIFKKIFENIKSADFKLKTWNEWYTDEYAKIKNLLDLF